jgi:siderophore synthetase component
MRCNIKLSLDIQITNLKRNNTKEQMRRTLDAARYLRRSRGFAQEPHTRIAFEEGVCCCAFEEEQATAWLTVAYRPIRFDTTATYVLSSLVEPPVRGEPVRLLSVMEPNYVEAWFRRYLDISLRPIVRIAEEQGIHFEAHLQNALLTVKDGMPDTFIIRDLEGVSVEREKAGEQEDTSGPLFYEREQARARTAYYFFVNHLGSLIHAIARDMSSDETYLWGIVREALAEEYESGGNEFAGELLAADAFYAKKNMTSCLAGNSETPDYVPVINRMKSIGREWKGAHKQLV